MRHPCFGGWREGRGSVILRSCRRSHEDTGAEASQCPAPASARHVERCRGENSLQEDVPARRRLRLALASTMNETLTQESIAVEALESHYRRVEDGIAFDAAEDYAKLVTPNSNSSEPFHRWFHMKEAYSAGLLQQVVKDCGLDDVHRGLRILDPFAGSGTTAVSAAKLEPTPAVWGVECNPFLHLLASVKHEAMQVRPSGLVSLAEEVTIRADSRTTTPERFSRPALSTFKNKKYFPQDELRRLLALVDELDSLAKIGDDLKVDLLRLAAAASVEPVSNLRRDGRALRYWPRKDRAHAYREFLRRAQEMADDIDLCSAAANGRQLLGDGRRMSCIPEDLSFDLAIFSPPYPNNIDYTEVYKLEAWLLGMISNRDEFRLQRLRTVHSHPSIRRPVPTDSCIAIDGIVAPILACIEPGRYAAGLADMIQGYVLDLVELFESLACRLRDGGYIACAVGNSVHGAPGTGVVVAADVLVLAAARIAGFEPQRIAVARNLTRRKHGSAYLRESVCFITREGR